MNEHASVQPVTLASGSIQGYIGDNVIDRGGWWGQVKAAARKDTRIFIEISWGDRNRGAQGQIVSVQVGSPYVTVYGAGGIGVGAVPQRRRLI